MRRLLVFVLALALGGLAAATVRAETFSLVDGSSLDGEIVSATERGMIVRLPDGKYSDRVGWEKLSQESLKVIAKNTKYASFVEGLVIEDEPEDQKKRPARPAIVLKQVEPRLERPANPALIGGFFGSAVGWLVVLALYAASLWGAYEIAIFRAQPVGLVCGLAAAVPVIPQIVFLSMATRMPKQEEGAGGEGVLPADAEPPMDPKLASSLKLAYEAPEQEQSRQPAQPTIFKRGEFMFNRRFFETRFTNFFTMVRRDKDRDTVLVIKTSKAEYAAHRITRISANDIHFEIPKGTISEEVSVSFVEIQEVQLRQGPAR